LLLVLCLEGLMLTQHCLLLCLLAGVVQLRLDVSLKAGGALLLR